MSEHKANVRWQLAAGEDFLGRRYSRRHTWSFDGGITVPASPSPAAVRPPLSDPEAVDPEEAFVAAIASCHMLTFLYLAARAGFEIRAYEDDAVGTMTKNERGVPWVSSVDLRPRIEYGAKRPSADEEARLHESAHDDCFIANSIKTAVHVGPPL